jgi:hypothetical protein
LIVPRTVTQNAAKKRYHSKKEGLDHTLIYNDKNLIEARRGGEELKRSVNVVGLYPR